MKHSWLRVAVAASLLVPSLALAGAPTFYVRKDTWQQTLLASREALLKVEQARLATAKEPVNSDAKGFRPTVVRNQTARSRAGRTIKVRVRGLQVLWLCHTSPQKGRDAKLAGCWGDAVLVGSDGKKTPLHTLKPLVTRGDVDVKAPAPAASGKKRGRPKGIRLGRTTVATGLIVKPDGELCYRLDGQYEMFTATVGVVSAANKKSIVEFHVSGVSLREIRQREADRARLWTLVQRDFSDAQAVTQMGREESCRIWEQDWTPGDRRSLANRYAGLLRSSHLAKTASDLARAAKTDADVQKLAALYHQWQDTADNLALAKQVDLKALRRAIEDLSATFGDQYPNGAAYLQRLAALEKLDLAAVAKGKSCEAAKVAADLVKLQRDALLGNPLLDFDKLLLVKRSTRSPKLGLPQNWQGNCSLPRNGYDNEIAVLSPVRPGGKLTTLHRPEGDRFVGDVDLQFDGQRILFSSMDKDKRWQVSEMKVDGTGLRQVTQGTIAEVDNYDPCYLPDGRILFVSAAVMHGVPCVGGKDHVANLYLMNPDGSG
ncbi:NPCBM/NEW2 domain-containing protein, partial [bacterium]|nr:NPCBM/NEW2 domain-containing protein [bacterium]